MNKKPFLFVLLLLSLAFFGMPAFAWAAEHYVRPDGTGDGSSWASATPALPDSLVRGDTYYVAGGSYPAYDFNDPEGAGGDIVVKKATLSDHGASDGWQESYGSAPAVFPGLRFSTSHYVFDGQTGGGPGAWESGYGFVVRYPGGRDGIAIDGGASHISISHTDMVADNSSVHGSTGLYGAAANGRGADSVTVSYSAIHDLFGAPVLIRRWTNFLFEHNYVARNISTPDQHSEAVSTQGGSGHVYRFNYFRDIAGTGGIVNLAEPTSDWDVYRNVFFRVNTGHGVLASNSGNPGGSPMSNIRFHDNLIVGSEGTNSGVRIMEGGTDNNVTHNIWYGSGPIGRQGIDIGDWVRNLYVRSFFTYEYNGTVIDGTQQPSNGPISGSGDVIEPSLLSPHDTLVRWASL